MADVSGYLQSTNVDRNQLILDHRPLLRHIAGRMALSLPAHIDREDLVAYGMIGLLTAADTFEPGRGLKFSTYAFPKIRGAILDELRKQDFLPRGRREKVRELDHAVAQMLQQDGIPPTPEEIAARMNVSVEEIDEIMLCAKSAHTTTLDDSSGEGLGAMLSDPRCDDPHGSAEWNETKQRLEEAIRALSEQDKLVITLYYAQDLMLREIAEVLGVTESRVSQIHTRALYRLNRELGGEA